jgi:hypothetical protein
VTTVERTFFGIPVEGDIVFNDRRVTQRPIEDLQPLMQAVLDDPTIEWFGWRQYTPYFNDGEPCVFSVHGALAVKLADGQRHQSLKCPNCEKDRDPDHVFCPACGHRHGEHDADDDDDDEYEDANWDGIEYSNVLGTRERNWNIAHNDYEKGTYSGPDEARYDRCLALEKAIESGAFDDALLYLFGDHATVKVHKDRVVVESYEHD